MLDLAAISILSAAVLVSLLLFRESRRSQRDNSGAQLAVKCQPSVVGRLGSVGGERWG